MKKKFSLIELMIAIIIISLLTTILSYQLMKTLDDSREIKVKQDLDKLKGIILQYQNDVLFTRREYATANNIPYSDVTGSFCEPVIFDRNHYLNGVTGEADVYVAEIPPVLEGHLSGDIIPEGIRMEHMVKHGYLEDTLVDPWGNEYSFMALSRRPGFKEVRKYFSAAGSSGAVVSYYFNQWEQSAGYNMYEGQTGWDPFLELYVGCVSDDIDHLSNISVDINTGYIPLKNEITGDFPDHNDIVKLKGYWVRVGIQKYESTYQ